MISRIFKFLKGDFKEKKEVSSKKVDVISKKNSAPGTPAKMYTPKKQNGNSDNIKEIVERQLLI